MRRSLLLKRFQTKQKAADSKQQPVSFEELDARIALIQALIPLGLKAVEETLQAEVKALAGERYSRQGGHAHYNRWGSQPGSVYLADQKVPVAVPRVRDKHHGCEVRLKSYEGLQQPRNLDEGLLKRIVNGLSCRNYRDCAEAVPEAFGLSSSTVSRCNIQATARKLEQLQERPLEPYDFVGLFLE